MKELEGLQITEWVKVSLNYYTIEISQQTEKSPEDLWGLAVTQISMKTISVSWCEKISRSKKNNNNLG